jgi:hypothetical protein
LNELKNDTTNWLKRAFKQTAERNKEDNAGYNREFNKDRRILKKSNWNLDYGNTNTSLKQKSG